MKIRLNIEISKTSENNWYIGAYLHSCTEYNPLFFIDGMKISTIVEDGKEIKFQNSCVNSELIDAILKVLFNGSKELRNLTESQAYDFYHFLLYSGFQDGVHPGSKSKTFFRFLYEGTQEQVYKKCKKLHKRWLKAFYKKLSEALIIYKNSLTIEKLNKRWKINR